MSSVKGLYKNTKTSEWHWDFVIRGHRFRGETGTKSQRKAEALVKEERRRAEREVGKIAAKGGHMTFGDASTRWFNEKGWKRQNQLDVETDLAWLQTEIGLATRLANIDDNLVARLVAKREAQGVANATVNRTVTERLRAIMLRARDIWKVQTGDVDWKEHLLPEPDPIEREASPGEEARLLEAMREDYRDMFAFDFLSGLRLAELVGMRWSRVDLTGNRPRFGIVGKGNRVAWLPLTAAMVEILQRQPRMPGQDAVWTYEPQRKTRDRRKVIERAPITYSGAKTQFRRARDRAGMTSRAKDPVAGFRLHDIRHTTATRVARAGGLAVAQKLLRHKEIATTMRYAFATEDDVLDAMEKAQAAPARAQPSKAQGTTDD